MSHRGRRLKRQHLDYISPAMLARAEQQAAENKARIEAGVTYASHKPNDWKRGGRRTP